MTTKPRPKSTRQRFCRTHQRYLANNCPLCIKDFLDKELPDDATPVTEDREASVSDLASSDDISTSRNS